MQDRVKRTVRAVMLQRGVTREELARLTGLKLRTIESCFTGKIPAIRTWCKIEFALQFPIICTDQELQARNVIAQKLGADPGSISLRDLRQRVKPFGVLITKRSRTEIINDLITTIQKSKEEHDEEE